MKITGLIGYPIEHSLSPRLHNSAFKYCNLDFIYLLFSVQQQYLIDAIKGIRGLNIKGVNITFPYKEKVIPYLDGIEEEVELINSVNTIDNQNSKLIGYNTDGIGFIKALNFEGKINLKNKKIVIIGAGGVGKSIGVQICKEEISSLVITDKLEEKAENFVNKLKKRFPRPINFLSLGSLEFKEEILNADILVNATNCGMEEGDPCVIEPGFLHSDLFIFDVIYNRKTELIKEAEKKQIKYLNGLSMLIYQGAEAFKIWTGVEAPIEIMKESVRREGQNV